MVKFHQKASTKKSEVQLLFDFATAPLPAADPSATFARSAVSESAEARFALRFATLLQSDPSVSFNNARISELSREIFGSAAGHARDAYDAAEAGFNIYLDRSRLDLRDTPAAIEQLVDEQARLPRQDRRDREQVEFQQFSTPPAQALLVIKAASLRAGMSVLEPSAGTGNLAVLAHLTGATVETNEIHSRRRNLLSLLGFEPTAFDAERLDNQMPAEKSYHAIVMNPPFSATGGRVNGHRTAFGARHIEQALYRLKPGGRLVAIVGRGMAMDRPGFGDWWADIGQRYHVRANVGMDGREYARFGTAFDNQIIVIDRMPPNPSKEQILLGTGLSIQAAYDLLKALSEEDVYGRVRQHDPNESGRADAPGLSPRAHVGNGSDSGVDRTASGRRLGGIEVSPGLIADARPLAHMEPTSFAATGGSGTGSNLSVGGGAVGTSNRDGSDAKLGGLALMEHARSDGVAVGQLESASPAISVEIEEGTVFAAYRVQKAIVRGAHPHPANIVESAAMACVEPPDVLYRHHLPADVIAEGRVSNLQLEDVIYAGQATNSLLPDGSRKGHWNGDGTGIGKGREIYAFIFNELMQGRRRHVHISASHQLCEDAERDRDALALPLSILHQARYKPNESIAAESGVLFTTYTMLSTDFAGDRQRFKQLTDWLGTDFDGVIAFDEAHLMKNAAATPHGGKASVDHGTLRGNMGITLQRMFPQARIRYFSATGATEARHMAPYERLGMWGAGAPFADFPAFLVAMQRGGVAAMEMLCRDLKSVGTYLSRTISFGPTRRPDGSFVPDSAVEYEPLVHRLSADERLQYDKIADLWSELLSAFDVGEQNAGQRRNGNRYAQYYSTQQRFFLQLMMAYSLPDVIPAIEEDLRHGRSVVLSLFNTGEAQTDRKVQNARAEGLDLSELDATPREMIVQLIEKQFPLYQYQERTDPVTGNVVRARVEDAAGNPEINRENQRRQRELLDKVADLDFPQNPLDALVSRFGVSSVAEVSGRTHRFENGKYVRRKIKGVARRELNAYETRMFQQGRKRIIVISGAGSTGISVHADVAARNQQRRVFYAFQLSWSADQQMQAFGRVHRSNQNSAPVIRLVLLDLAGQKRLVNAVSKRLAALGALTKGERHSLSSDLFRPEDVTDEFGRAALARLYREIQSGNLREEGLDLSLLDRMGVLESDKGAVRESCVSNVEQFLNRIMVLHVETQNRIFDLFYDRYVAALEAAKRQGAFDFGVEEIRARNLRRVTEPETLFVDPTSGARTMLHDLEGEVDVVRHTFESVASGAKLGFWRNRVSGRVYGATEHWDRERSEVYLVPVKGPKRSLEESELKEKYEPVELPDACSWWEDEYAKTPATEPRGFYILSGAIFPIYDKVMGSSGVQSVKIARAVLADGQALVGLNLSPTDVPNVKLRLGIGTSLAEASPNDILDLLSNGSTIELDNGWRLTSSSIVGDNVVELVLNGVPANREELNRYGFSEEIIHYKRRWFVVQTGAVDTVERLLAHRKPVTSHGSRSVGRNDPVV